MVDVSIDTQIKNNAVVKEIVTRVWEELQGSFDKPIGVLDVTMADKTHLYIVACTSFQQDDLIVSIPSSFLETWKTLTVKIEHAFEHFPHTVLFAPLHPSTRIYWGASYRRRSMSTFTDKDLEEFWKCIGQRMENRRAELLQRFNLGEEGGQLSKEQCTTLSTMIDLSVGGMKLIVYSDIEEVVHWHKKLLQKDGVEMIKLTNSLACADISEFVDIITPMLQKHLPNPDKIKERITTVMNCFPQDSKALEKLLIDLNLRTIDDSVLGCAILSYCSRFIPGYNNCSRLADYFAQCAEDNATIALVKYLKDNQTKQVKSCKWYCTEYKKGVIKDKRCCGICKVRFRDRLVSLIEDTKLEPKVSMDDEDTQIQNNQVVNNIVTEIWKVIKGSLGKPIGVLDVMMADDELLYVVACSSTGQNDQVVNEPSQSGTAWEEKEEVIRNALTNLQVKFIIAPRQLSTLTYCGVGCSRALSKFEDKVQEEFWECIEQRMQSRRRELLKCLELDEEGGQLSKEQHEKLVKLLKTSVHGRKLSVDNLGDMEFNEVVSWYERLLLINGKTMIELTTSLPRADISTFVDKITTELLNPDEIKKRITTVKDSSPQDIKALLIHLNLFRFDNNVLDRTIWKYCCRWIPSGSDNCNYTGVADYFAQCAEDNATIALVTFLEKYDISNQFSSLEWYCTEYTQGEIKDKPCCAVCKVCFRDRLLWLIKYMQGDPEVMQNV